LFTRKISDGEKSLDFNRWLISLLDIDVEKTFDNADPELLILAINKYDLDNSLLHV
jgi:hypothetical protein